MSVHTAPASVVVVTFKGGAALEACLQSLRRQTKRPLEVIVVDNGGGSRALVAQALPEAIYLPLHANAGFAVGCNHGAELSTGRWLAFLNDDAVAEPEWLEYLVEAATIEPTIGVVSSRIYRGSVGASILDSAGGIIEYPLGDAPPRGYLQPDGEAYDVPADVDYAPAAAFLIRRDLFEDLKGFDESYFLYHEEVDLCWRARLLGWRIVYAPRALVYHLGSHTIGASSAARTYHQTRNRIVTNLKLLPPGDVVRWLGAETVHAVAIATGTVLFREYRAYGRAYLRGLASAVLLVPAALRRRSTVGRLAGQARNRVLKTHQHVPLPQVLRRYAAMTRTGRPTLFGPPARHGGV